MPLPNELGDVALPGADRASGNNCGLPFRGHIGNGTRFLLNIQADEQGASLRHG
jgi:hypothetical protein